MKADIAESYVQINSLRASLSESSSQDLQEISERVGGLNSDMGYLHGLISSLQSTVGGLQSTVDSQAERISALEMQNQELHNLIQELLSRVSSLEKQ